MIHLRFVTWFSTWFLLWKVALLSFLFFFSFSQYFFIISLFPFPFSPSFVSISAIHNGGIAHRDIKPKNFLLEKRTVNQGMMKNPGEWSKFPFSIRICDFGVCFVDQAQISSALKFKNIFGVSYRFLSFS